MIQSASALSLGTSPVRADLTTLFPNTRDYGEVKIINASPNPALVAIGSDSHWLDSWGADVFCLRGLTALTITPVVIATPAPSLQVIASALISLASAPGEIPGVYPCPVDRTALLGQTVQTFSLTAGNSQIFPIPAGAVAVQVAANAIGGGTTLTVTGNNSSQVYYKGQHNIGSPLLAVNSAIDVRDTSLSVAVSGLSTVAGTIAFSNLPLPNTLANVLTGSGGPVTAPSAGATIASVTQGIGSGVLTQGIYEVRCYCGYGATGDVPNNMQFDGAVICSYRGGANTMDLTLIPEYSIGTGHTVAVTAIANGAGGSLYFASIILTFLRPF